MKKKYYYLVHNEVRNSHFSLECSPLIEHRVVNIFILGWQGLDQFLAVRAGPLGIIQARPTVLGAPDVAALGATGLAQ